ncbi:hypothetical protein KTJ53_15420 [Acinetobacter variabilis]|uniref:phage tail tip fiber protein n=1 Tax=Acinetobacter variabilis TaxID=70346 RepID=UPI0021D0D56D|nr:hypothetical protein [Acinetobacter variabilis]MCU4631031.1 hypothetical protein [Acinetobacter variabilis]
MANLVNTLLKNRKLQSVITKAKTTNAAIPKVEDPTLQTWIKAIDSNLKEAAKKAVTKGDLINLGLAGVKNGNLEGLIPKPEQVDLTVPAAVANLQANGAYSTVTLDWETPPNANFGYNAVYRSEINDFGAAIQIGSTLGDVYTDYIGNAAKVYYWVRTISKYDVEGEISPSVYAETSINIEYYLDQLKGKISKNQFTQSLKEEIARIDLNAKAITQEALERANVILREREAWADAIKKEISERTQALSDYTADLIGRINEEREARKAEIFNETQARSDAILTEHNAWRDAIKKEISERTQALSDYAASIVTRFNEEREAWSRAVAAEAKQRTDAIGATVDDYIIRFTDEREAWQNAILQESKITSNRIQQTLDDVNEQLANETNLREQQIQSEAEARQGAITQEAADRAKEIAQEVQNRQLEITAEALARIEGDKVVDKKIEVLSSSFADNDKEIRGLIVTEAETRANETGVISTKLDGVYAQVNPSMAGGSELAGDEAELSGVWTETSARIEGDLVLSDRITAVQAVVMQNDQTIKALITEEQQARVTADSALATQFNAISAEVMQNDKTIKALITEEQTTRANADSALAKQVDTIQAQANQNTVAITTEQKLRADADSALATEIKTLTAQTDDVLSMITTEMEVRSDAINALSREMTFISAGVGEQFDTKTIYFFDDGADNWTCEQGEPIVENGYIRAADSTTPNYLISPGQSGAIDGSTYPHLRTRIQKVGTPLWSGQILYGDNFNQSFILNEPIWDADNIGLLQANVAWEGEITQIKVKFLDHQDQDNYYFIDWIAIGRPSPSASYSALMEEQTARTEADRANAESIRSLTATIKNNDTDYKALIAEEQRVRAEKDGVLAESISTLSADFTKDLKAAITTEQKARADDKEALAEQISGVQAKFTEDLGAAILSEQNARADDKEAVAKQFESIQAQFTEDLGAAVKVEQDARADDKEALAKQINSIQAKFTEDLNAAITLEQKARADDKESIAEQFESIDAQFGEVDAAIVAEQKARADETGALATKLDGVYAQVNPSMAGDESGLAGDEGIIAGVWTETSARIEGDIASAERIDALKSEVNLNDQKVTALITEESRTRAANNDAFANRFNAVDAKIELEGQTVRGLISSESEARATDKEALAKQINSVQAKFTEDLNAAITLEQKARADDKESIAEQFESVDAQFGEVDAAIVAEQKARADDKEALAEQISGVQAKFTEDLGAAITTEQKARADDKEAVAKQIDSVQANFAEDLNAAITTEQNARANDYETLTEKIDTFYSEYEENSATIQNKIGTFADSTKSIAEHIETLQSDLGENSIKLQQTSKVVDGLTAEWKVKVDQNGSVSGITFGVDGDESAFTVMTNRFSVISPEGVISVPFNIDKDGKTFINDALIPNASITSAKIKDLSADKITSGNIAAERMKANIVAAVEGQFTSLSALTAKIGHLRTATSGARTEIKDNLIEVYDSDDKLRVRLGVW